MIGSPNFISIMDFGHSTATSISPQYLAGFIDGEGNLGIERINNGKAKSFRWLPSRVSRIYYRSPEHTIRIQVSNTNLDGLRAIQHDYGGSLTAMKAPNRPRNKQAFKLTWTSRRAEGLLSVVGPHLVLKRPQYGLILEFMKFRQKNKRLGGSNGRLDPSVIEIRDDFQRRLKELNRRGVRDGPPQV